MSKQKTASFRIEPEQAILIDIDRGQARTATLSADCAFAIGDLRYAAHHLHRQPEAGQRRRKVAVRALGSHAGTIEVSWR